MSITDTSSSPFVKLRSVSMHNVRWTDGFWADRFAHCRDVMVPTMGALMTDAERYRYVGNFEVANGVVEGRHRGPKWNDGDFYKWIEAAASTLAFTRDEVLDRQLDAVIDLMARTQAPDGYIHTDVQIAQRRGAADVRRFGDPMDFEMYNLGHLI